MADPPRVFISYSHDSEEHKSWVYNLSCALARNGIYVILDQFDLHLGSNLSGFMTNGLAASDRVIVVCTDGYVERAERGIGGVGYEAKIMTAELYADESSHRIIPCVRQSSRAEKIPQFMGIRLYLDMKDDALFEQELERLVREIHGAPERPRPRLGPHPFAENQIPPNFGSPSTVFFANRLASAFPGSRGIDWFHDPQIAVRRLQILFAPPYEFRGAAPIWWWRDGEIEISKFTVLAQDEVLLGPQEYILDKLAVANPGIYYKSFIYVETRPSASMQGTTAECIQAQLAQKAYADEEYAMYRGIPISRHEYDDGAAVIGGEVVKTSDSAELRIRCLTKCNFLVAPQGSPINNRHFDSKRVSMLDAMLRGELVLDDLADEIYRLPKRTSGAT